MADYSAFFQRHAVALQQSALYVLRPNPTFQNPTFEDAPYRVLITRLSPFRDVDRSTPHLFLAQAVRHALPHAYVDMAFFPPQHDRERLLQADVPLWTGVQSCHSLEDFDLVLISNAYVLELINLPYILLHSGVPVWASQRDEAGPILVLGGSNALATQVLLGPERDCMVDALFFGEGERQVEALAQCLASSAHLSKVEQLTRAAEAVTGVWVAGQDAASLPVEKAVLAAPDADDMLVEYPMLNSAEASTARLQITYGCPAFCTFCFEGYDRKPYREVPLDALLKAARQLKAEGMQTLELYSFNFNTHADIFTLLLTLNRWFERVSFKSQRVDVLYETPGLLDAEVAADKRSFTLGVEGISPRMRAWLHKSLDSRALMGVLNALFRQKIREIKLFYLLTGYETAEDLEAFHDFLDDVKFLWHRARRRVRVIFSFGLLVRMPFTPLRYDRLFLDEGEWRSLMGRVKSACETHGFEFRLAVPWDDYCASQVLALGGTWLHRPVVALAEQGHCYDLSLSPGYWDALRAWMEARGYWTPEFLGAKGSEYPFALDFVRSDIASAFLYQQYEQAQTDVDGGYCLGGPAYASDIERGTCLGCGACRTPEQRAAITGHMVRPPSEAGYRGRLQALMQEKWRLKPVYARLWLPESVAGADPAWINAWVLRHVLRAYPALAEGEVSPNVLSVQEALFTTKAYRDRYMGLYGETVFALTAWDVEALMEVLVAGVADGGDIGDGMRVVGAVRDFVPDALTKISLALSLPSDGFPDAGQQLRAFLLDQYVPVNVRRLDDEGRYRFDIPAKALKKKMLFEGQYHQDAEWFTASITVGPKFDLVGFLKSFGTFAPLGQARVAVRGLE